MKLDIDNVALESQLIDQIRGDPVAKSMIAEMHFEMHVSVWVGSLQHTSTTVRLVACKLVPLACSWIRAAAA